MESGIPTSNAKEIDNSRCNQDVFDYGIFVCFFEGNSSEADLMCKGRTEATGRQHDWHNSSGRKRILALPEGWTPPPVQVKDHEIAHVVNTLRDIGIKYGQSQQLREQISGYLGGILKQLAKPRDLDLTSIDAGVELNMNVKLAIPGTGGRETFPLPYETQLQIAAVLFQTVASGGQITPEQQQQLIEFIARPRIS